MCIRSSCGEGEGDLACADTALIGTRLEVPLARNDQDGPDMTTQPRGALKIHKCLLLMTSLSTLSQRDLARGSSIYTDGVLESQVLASRLMRGSGHNLPSSRGRRGQSDVWAHVYSHTCTGYVQNEAVDVLAKLDAKCTIWEARMEGERWRFAGINEDPRRNYTTYATHAITTYHCNAA